MSNYPPDGVRVQQLRSGTEVPLFVVPGLEGDPEELRSLVSALTGAHEVIALAPLLEDTAGRPVTSIPRIAELMVEVVRQLVPEGPFLLGGYSYGGLIALEVAQQLRAAGDKVESLFLIDAVYDERYWPRAIWLEALARRTGRQLGRIARLPPRAAAAELRLRGGRLTRRVIRRNTDAATGTNALHSEDETAMSAHAKLAIGQYAPRFYDGQITLIASSVDRHFGCDTTELWADYAEQLQVQRVVGDHLTVMHDPIAAAQVAAVIDHGLAVQGAGWLGLVPRTGFERPLILTTMRWFSAARLAHALAESGFVVSACRPRGHALELVDSLASDSRLHKLAPLRSLTTAIRRAQPDIIICDDERALALMRRLYKRTLISDPDVAAVIAHSLGDINQWTSTTSRTALANEAHALQVPAPQTAVVSDLAELDAWVAGREFPVTLKTDGSWGGRGVAIVRDPARLHGAWDVLSNPPGLARGIKRAVVDQQAGSLLAWMRREHPVVNAQEYIAGREGIVTAACVDGKMQALVCLEVVDVAEARGPATAVRIIDHPGMAESARQLAAHLGLSGFCGFDFMLTADGTAVLVEINPRVTPTCHLLVEGDYVRNRVVALFPPDQLKDPAPGISISDVLDVPPRAPTLVERGTEWTARRHHPLSRAMRRLERAAGRSGD